MAAAPREVQFGPRRVMFPGPHLGHLRRSAVAGGNNPAAGGAAGVATGGGSTHAELRARLADDGYLFLPGLNSRAATLAARDVVLDHFAAQGGVLVGADVAPRREGVLEARCGVGCVPFMEGANAVTGHPAVLGGVLESATMRAFFDGLFGGESRTFDFKWLRGVPTGRFTGAHCDIVYMGRGTHDVVTSWLPFGENPAEMGSLAILAGSHVLPGFAQLRRSYGAMDHERDGLDGTGWLTMDPAEPATMFGGRWLTADFSPGDVLVFGMQTMHMSTTNVTGRVRVSCDVRWQPAAEPADPRYVGEIDIAAFAKAGLGKEEVDAGAAAGPLPGEEEEGEAAVAKAADPKVTIGELKAKWGIVPDEAEVTAAWEAAASDEHCE